MSYTYTNKSEKSTADCRGFRIRRGQLSQIFDPQYVTIVDKRTLFGRIDLFFFAGLFKLSTMYPVFHI